MLCDWLIAPFVHRSHQSTAIAVARSVMISMTVDPPIRCSSGSSIAFNMFGVGSWFFPCGLFHRYWSLVAGVVSPSCLVRHGRCRARFVQRSMQLGTSVGAHSCGEHVGAFAIAGNLAVSEISPVEAAVAVVSARGRG